MVEGFAGLPYEFEKNDSVEKNSEEERSEENSEVDKSPLISN